MNISVIIPAYKAAHTITRAVESVFAQTYPASEVIIVDDGSPDDISEKLDPYDERVTLLQKENGGAASARNFGIDNATGDLIAFLDADDYWEPTKLQRHVALYEAHPELGLTCSRYFTQEPGQNRKIIQVEGIVFDQVVNPMRAEAFEYATFSSTATVVVSREALSGERFISGLETAEDRELWFRLIDKAPMYFLSDSLATAVLEPGSLSRTNVERDCGNLLKVVHLHRERLGKPAHRREETIVFRRWAAGHLGESRPKAAIRPAIQRLVRTPLSIEGWWILAKSIGWSIQQSLVFRRRRHNSRTDQPNLADQHDSIA